MTEQSISKGSGFFGKTAKNTKRARYFIPIGLVVGLLVVLAVTKASQIATLIRFGQESEKAGPPPETVASAKAKTQDWHATLSAVGTVAASKGVTLSNDAPGIVRAIHFESGDRVRQGQVILELDTSVERAQLRSAEARGQQAAIDRARTEKLAKQDVVSESELESQQTNFATSSAEVSALQAQISKKIVRAPFGGVLGIRMVNLGQYLNPGTPIAVLQSSENQYVDFQVPQERLDDIEVGTPVHLRVEGTEQSSMRGSVAAIDATVDEVTRMVKIRASVENAENELRAGMFVNVEVQLPDSNKQVIVPQTAVVHASYGDSVFVIEPGKDEEKGKASKVVRQQFVKTGVAQGDFIAIEKGLKGSEVVVSQGAFKLRNGAPVVINNKVDLEPSLQPRPSNS